MSDNTYNGWTNWETWNLKLWLDNDESTYNIVQRMVRRVTSYDEFEDSLLDFCFEMWPNGTPDMDGKRDMLKVCWAEVATAYWQEAIENGDIEPEPEDN